MSSDATIAQQNDPHELLEVFDAHGRPTGVAKSRASIHIDGDWHQAFHCWIVRPNGDVVLQRRSLVKDTFAGFWDASAAGHWRFGESAEQAAREISEELGIDFDFAALRYHHRERVSRRFPHGLIDHEHHQVYTLVSALPLAQFRPDPAEVSGLAAVPGQALVGLLARSASRVTASEGVAVAADGTLTPEHMSVERSTLVPYAPGRMRRILGL